MHTKDVVSKLRLLADTIEELEIDGILECRIGQSTNMGCHLLKLTVTGAAAEWTERYDPTYNWEKSFIYNNIRFFALYTQKDYLKETLA